MSTIRIYMRQKSATVGCRPNMGRIGGVRAQARKDNNVNIPKLPPEISLLDNQVAGHSFNDGKNTIGMLKNKDGKILKPITKPMCGERETQFYKELQTTVDPILLEMREFVPKFFGTHIIRIGEKDEKFIAIQNLTDGVREPCIMDIKIGKRTWDPLATPEKIDTEKKKYISTRSELGFCIPGFQVIDIKTGRLKKYGKEYGKSLNKDTIKTAFKTFLNAESGLNRHLLVQILAQLWRILHWCRTQTKLRLYSSSILIVYDAYRLRKCMGSKRPEIPSLRRSLSLKVHNRPMSVALNLSPEQKADLSKPSFSGLLTSTGPLFVESHPFKSLPMVQTQDENGGSKIEDSERSWHGILNKVKRTHSFTNDYEKNLRSMKDDYIKTLNDLVTSEQRELELWAQVKMIDFAHIFPSESNELDDNYLCGIENLVKIFEEFLEQTFDL